MQSRPSIRSILLAVASLFCAGAGTMAVIAPEGPVRNTAATIANQCEANGFRAYPEEHKPAPAVDAGTPSPTLPGPVLELPPVPFRDGVRVELVPLVDEAALLGGRAELVAPRLVLVASYPPPAPRWPGEARGWV